MEKRQKGSIEFVTLALLAALVVVLALPALSNIGQSTEVSPTYVSQQGANPQKATP